MNDFRLPERPLPDEVRAQRREELLTAIQAPVRRGWLLPAAAAAVVALVSIGATVVLTGNDPTPEPSPAGAPAETTTAAASQAPQPASETTRPPRPGSAQESPPVPCAELGILPGEEVGAIEIGETTVRVYSDGTRWATCDEWAAGDGGEATAFAPQPVGVEPNKDLFLISMNFSLDDPGAAEYVAGGLLPEGVTGISYTFPGGHTEDAVIDDGIWAMAHFPTTGPMVASRVPNEPIIVEVALSGVVQTHELRADRMEWCAQVNHGC